MKMLYCRRCGTAIISDETLLQSIIDQMNAVNEKIPRAKGIEKTELIHEVSQYKTMYKALVHNITSKEYAEAVTPYILHEMLDIVRSKHLLTEAEINQIYDSGKRKAQKTAEQLRKKEKLIYGTFEALSNRTKPDPTANAAIANADRAVTGGGRTN